MEIVPLEAPVGAEVRGVDLTKPLSEEDVATVRQAFADHLMLVVKGQQLEGEDHDRFIKHLGPLETFDNGAQVQFMTNKKVENAAEAGNARLLFHNDGAYRPNPRAGTSLYALEVSPTSPPTSFANGVRAYESLAPDLQEEIAKLTAFHLLDLEDPYGESNRQKVTDLRPGRTVENTRNATHPLVITLPHSGRKALFVSEFYTSHIVEFGESSEEGEALLQKLFAALYAEDNTYSHHYSNGDLVVWDNLGVQHARSGSVDNNPRHLRRLVLKSVDW
ncbi:TauD/TfdA family dioxygenase [Pseudonocardia kujensis]|uniref:TauD/TfdA dioxygenase family protein n=1 Tax=Pseudonocardia kujensis TaxID=1128675 RepID=UPI001E5F45B3|nr:TauD/TfdA family dioxygenase [Pseudonocardia kujensis]MCE0767816.1 TauD/TfdA family dioxygenase [Pseudonocardia kujensis]